MVSTALATDSSDQESDSDNSYQGNLLKDIDNYSGGLDLSYKFLLKGPGQQFQ